MDPNRIHLPGDCPCPTMNRGHPNGIIKLKDRSLGVMRTRTDICHRCDPMSYEASERCRRSISTKPGASIYHSCLPICSMRRNGYYISPADGKTAYVKCKNFIICALTVRGCCAGFSKTPSHKEVNQGKSSRLTRNPLLAFHIISVDESKEDLPYGTSSNFPLCGRTLAVFWVLNSHSVETSRRQRL